MKKIFDLNREWFDKTNEVFVDYLTKGSSALAETISSSQLKRDVCLAMTSLMLQVANGRLKLNSDDKETDQQGIDSKYMEEYQNEIRSVYDKFEDGKDYAISGLIESSLDLFSRKMSKITYEAIAEKEVYEVQKLMEDFWAAFFELKKSGEKKKDTSQLEDLLAKFDTNVNQALAA